MKDRIRIRNNVFLSPLAITTFTGDTHTERGFTAQNHDNLWVFLCRLAFPLVSTSRKELNSL
jgi:hypothetical protein